MMKGFGFNEPLLQWTENIISTATTSVLLNGVPGKLLACKRGVRQRDPMSPILFVMTTELLQCIINKAHHMGLIQMHIPSRGITNFPIIQYADDTILIMQASQRELLCLKAILKTFAQSIGLRVNYAKSCMVPLNMTEEKAELMTGFLGCKLQGMPFTYLGLPMGTTKPRVEHFAPLMNRVERQLTSISNMLTYVGKLQLVNSVISSLPTYTMCSISVPVEVHEYVDRARRHCM
jgi:hypothetical protein